LAIFMPQALSHDHLMVRVCIFCAARLAAWLPQRTIDSEPNAESKLLGHYGTAAGEAEETVMETGVAEKRTGYSGVETDSESRPTIVDEIRSVIQNLRRSQGVKDGVKGGGFIDAVLRGLGQVVFQNNSLTGLLVLLAISVNSFVYAGAALFGAVVSTYTAMLLRIDNRLVRDGLFGFNGALTAIAMVAFSSKEFAHGDPPSALLTLYVGLAAGFSTILARAFAFMIRNDRVPGLNFPYCVATILLLGALHGFSGLGAGTVGHASPLSLGTHVYANDTWLCGIGTGISQIFLQDNWLTGIVLVAAIAVNSPIAAAAVVAGSAMAVAVGCLLGVSEVFIRRSWAFSARLHMSAENLNAWWWMQPRSFRRTGN
jgi:urea transporter